LFYYINKLQNITKHDNYNATKWNSQKMDKKVICFQVVDLILHHLNWSWVFILLNM
jgi:hypothetical protein